MAPIPSRLPEEILSLVSATERRYIYINQMQVPKLRTCVGLLSLQQKLFDEIQEDIALLAKQIDELEMMVDDLYGEKKRKELWTIVGDFKTKLESLRKDARAALLTSKRAIDTHSKLNRDELFATSSTREKQETQSEKLTDDALMKANADVTEALRRTINLMQFELERSVLTSQLLDSSTASLRSTSLQHDVFSSVMSTSKQLLTALEKSDWLDRVLIFSAFAFFILVVLFIMRQRILVRGLRLAFWWTRYLPSFGHDAEVLRSAVETVEELSIVPVSSTSVASSSFRLMSDSMNEDQTQIDTIIYPTNVFTQ